MNFEIHDRAIVAGIAAILALALMAGSAYADPGNGQGPKFKGPQLSVDVFNLCTIDGNFLTIDSEITETSDDEVFGIIEPDNAAVSVTAIRRGKQVLGNTVVNPYANGSEINLCTIPNIEDASKINVLIALEFSWDGETKSYTSGCDDDPSNNVYDPETGDLIYIEELDESNLDISGVSCE